MRESKVSPFLTFNGQASHALDFYASIFPDTKKLELVRFGENHPFAKEDEQAKILFGSLSISGQEIMVMDMDKSHPVPEFSWSTSLYFDCKDEEEFDRVFDKIKQSGTVMMGPEAVGNIRKCAWVTDKFGVTWQLVWE